MSMTLFNPGMGAKYRRRCEWRFRKASILHNPGPQLWKYLVYESGPIGLSAFYIDPTAPCFWGRKVGFDTEPGRHSPVCEDVFYRAKHLAFRALISKQPDIDVCFFSQSLWRHPTRESFQLRPDARIWSALNPPLKWAILFFSQRN